MTTTEQPPEVDEAVDGRAADLADAPIIGRRRAEDPPERTAQFQLATYDSRNRETLHLLTARVDIDASSVFGFLSPKVKASERVAALRAYLLRSLVDDDGIGVREDVVSVVPDPNAKAAAGTAPEYVPVDSVDPDQWNGPDLRYRVGDQTLWETEDAAIEHGLVHGSSLRRFGAIMDDDTVRIHASALEEIVEYLGKQGAGEHPTKRPSSGSRSRSRKKR